MLAALVWGIFLPHFYPQRYLEFTPENTWLFTVGK
nr:MAG TPA_asm: hypothetical protein [Caudoviricetes sp.]